jgi:hypothetical protein
MRIDDRLKIALRMLALELILFPDDGDILEILGSRIASRAFEDKAPLLVSDLSCSRNTRLAILQHGETQVESLTLLLFSENENVSLFDLQKRPYQ